MNVTRKLLTKCHNYDIILGTGVVTVSGPLKYVLKDKRLFDMAFGRRLRLRTSTFYFVII